MKKGLVIIHVDALSYFNLEKGLRANRLPFVQKLLDEEAYEIKRYRCGIPSTTPCVQAGILYGDNSEIPAFRWFDKESGLPVKFGINSSFKKVEQKYFQGSDPLIKNGACFAACFPAGAKETFGLSYRNDNNFTTPAGKVRAYLAFHWLTNPFNVVNWLLNAVEAITILFIGYLQTILSGNKLSYKYFFIDVLEQLYAHHLTQFAVKTAMKSDYPIIYAGLYAYDETAHALGPSNPLCDRMLGQINTFIENIARQRKQKNREYELVILSDHGSVDSTPFPAIGDKKFAEIIEKLLPNFSVEEIPGIKSEAKNVDGHIILTYSCSLAHLYFRDIPERLDYDEIEKRFPGFIDAIAKLPEIDFLLFKGKDGDQLIQKNKIIKLYNHGKPTKEAIEFLQNYDDKGEIIARQLHKLNSYKRCGDIIIFGKNYDGHFINFENQRGGHGTIGKNQMFPFIMGKKKWQFETDDIWTAEQIHPMLQALKKQLSII